VTIGRAAHAKAPLKRKMAHMNAGRQKDKWFMAFDYTHDLWLSFISK
jgi:hypothetical protein